MKKFNLIVAKSQDNIIGSKDKLPWHLPEDLARFKTLTKHSVVVMGRKTYESIGKPLPYRVNVIISGSIENIKNAIVYSNIDSCIGDLQAMPLPVWIIGGASIYKEFLDRDLIDKVFITEVHGNYSHLEDLTTVELPLEKFVLKNKITYANYERLKED